MKKPALIIATVAGYSLVETALLLIFMPDQGVYQGSQRAFLALAQFLTIPGMTALFSLVLNGRYRWKTIGRWLFSSGRLITHVGGIVVRPTRTVHCDATRPRSSSPASIGGNRYLHFGTLRVSNWGVGTLEDDEPKRRPPDGEGAVMAQRDFQIGKAKLTCLAYHPSWDQPMRANAGPLVLIECEGSDRLHANFLGEGIQHAGFLRDACRRGSSVTTRSKVGSMAVCRTSLDLGRSRRSSHTI